MIVQKQKFPNSFFDEKAYSFVDRNSVKYLNVEITTKCSLKCPMCPRTNFSEYIDPRHEMPIGFIDKMLFSESLEKIYLCGANGEPTQHSQFLKVLEVLKLKTRAQINFHTHGSFKPIKWWDQVFGILDPTDHIIFSVDGLKDTNHIYRINSNWDQIELALRAAAKRVRTTWKYIVFSHNEHQIEEAVLLAKKWGVTWFSLKKSDRWNNAYRPDGVGDDWMSDMKPSDQYVSYSSLDVRTVYDINKKFNSAGNFEL